MMEIKRAVLSNIREIEAIEKENFSDAWNAKMIEEELNSLSSAVFVALGEDKLVKSYIILHFVLDEAEILRIATQNASKNKGYAEALLSYAAEELKKVRVKAIFLEVKHDNVSAKRLYEKHGFKKIATRAGYYNGEDGDIYKSE
ncbi:MAG: ribosomal protein S18-alanine N-acetyltransferase [Clostridiales bacterium]|jgi:ribosomal-protein-alanine N-acetyltransferase|nr:ribosomal protein S18-alanine N-acetyltransferase [Clostridiales bacterium]